MGGREVLSLSVVGELGGRRRQRRGERGEITMGNPICLYSQEILTNIIHSVNYVHVRSITETCLLYCHTCTTQA